MSHVTLPSDRRQLASISGSSHGAILGMASCTPRFSKLSGYKDRICVPQKGDFKQMIMDEAHNSAYSIHPGSTKMYMDLKQKYWWNGMKADIARFVARCDTCQRIKAEHQKPAGLLQPLPIPVWKWDEIGMDFVVGLPRTQKGHDSIWLIVDRLTKSAHFIPVRINYGGEKLAKLYVENIVKLHGVPGRIVSDRGTQFTSRFWKSLHKAMGTKLDFSSAYHPQTDGQTERVNQIMKICLEHVSSLTAGIGSRVYPTPSSHTTMGIKQAWACRRSKLSTEENAKPL